MAPKNKKKNGFYFFMKERQEEMARKGVRVTMSTLPNLVHTEWKNLSPMQREEYEIMAKGHNHDPNLRGGKLASDGKRLEDYEKELREEETQENAMINSVNVYVNSYGDVSVDDFKDMQSKKVFHFISFNLLCHTENEYIPIEVGLVKYSIQYGIFEEYHKILQPGPIPTGYTGDAKRLSEKHMIDIFGAEGSERDMKLVYQEILDFLDPEGLEYPPVFYKDEEKEQTKGCLDWLSRKTRDKICLETWSSKHLLMALRKGVQSCLPNPSIAASMLNRTCFEFYPQSRCQFHDENDVQFCALSVTKCLCYLLSDALCNLYDVELTEKHMPSCALEEKQYVVSTFWDKPTYRKEASQINLDKRKNFFQNNYDKNFWNKPLPQAEQALAVQNHQESVPGPSEKPKQPRQPASSCLAAEMTRLSLNMTAATVPGHGIGRGKGILK